MACGSLSCLSIGGVTIAIAIADRIPPRRRARAGRRADNRGNAIPSRSIFYSILDANIVNSTIYLQLPYVYRTSPTTEHRTFVWYEVLVPRSVGVAGGVDAEPPKPARSAHEP